MLLTPILERFRYIDTMVLVERYHSTRRVEGLTDKFEDEVIMPVSLTRDSTSTFMESS